MAAAAAIVSKQAGTADEYLPMTAAVRVIVVSFSTCESSSIEQVNPFKELILRLCQGLSGSLLPPFDPYHYDASKRMQYTKLDR